MTWFKYGCMVALTVRAASFSFGDVAATQRPPGLYTERPWRRIAGLDPGSVRRLDNERGRVAFHGADQ
jgi:hypothetical protein